MTYPYEKRKRLSQMDKAKLYNVNDPNDRCRCPQYKPKRAYNTSKTKIRNIIIIDLPRRHCKILFVAVVVRKKLFWRYCGDDDMFSC